MKNNEVKILANMIELLPKIKNKNFYTEEDFFEIYKLICGYRKLENYFQNSNEINGILEKDIDGYKLEDLIRIVRNIYSHIDKVNNTEKLAKIQVNVEPKEIHKLINEISSEINNKYKEWLNEDIYRLLINSKPFIMLSELLKAIVSYSKAEYEWDQIGQKLLEPIISKYEFDSSSIEDFNKMNEQVINVYKIDVIREGIINQYGIESYNELLRMLEDDSYTIEEAKIFLEKLINESKEEINQ